MSTITELGTLDLAGTKKGKISISNVTEPYGKDTCPKKSFICKVAITTAIPDVKPTVTG